MAERDGMWKSRMYSPSFEIVYVFVVFVMHVVFSMLILHGKGLQYPIK